WMSMHDSTYPTWWHLASTVNFFIRTTINNSGGDYMFKNTLLATSLAFLSTAQASFAAPQGNVTVHITGLRNSKGVVRIALFNSADSYTKSKGTEGNAAGAFQKAAAPISAQQATYSFDSLPYGDYAVKMFHDEDNSGKFETGLFGIPKVEY